MAVYPYLSHSGMQSHRMCQKSWELHYVDHVPVTVSGEIVRGGAYHKAVEFAYIIKRDYNGEIPELEAVLSVYSDEWDKSLKNRIVLADDNEEISIPSVDFGDKDPGKIKDDGVTLLKMYYNSDLFRQTQPIAVEVKKNVIYQGVPLYGIIDVITNIPGLTVDHKTTSKAYSDAQIQTNTQSSFYAILQGLDSIDFNIHQAIARAYPAIVMIPIHRDHDDIEWMRNMIVGTWKQIQSGVFVANPYGWWCGKEQCKYWNYCHLGGF